MKVSSVQFEMTAVTRSAPCPALPVRVLLLAVCHICPSAFRPVFNSAISNGVGCRFLFFNIYQLSKKNLIIFSLNVFP